MSPIPTLNSNISNDWYLHWQNQTSPIIGITASKSNIADDFVYFLNLNSKSNINDKDFYSFLKSNITDSWYFYFKTKTYSYFHKISHRRLNFSSSSNPKTSITDDNLYSYRKTDIRLDKRHAKPSNRPATRRRQTARKSAWKQGRSPASPLAERVKQQSCLPYLKTVRSGLRLGRHRR